MRHSYRRRKEYERKRRKIETGIRDKELGRKR